MRGKTAKDETVIFFRLKTVILEIDPPVDAIAQRRKGFYERCGFVENPYSHIHLPCHQRNAGHEFIIMSSPQMLKSDECERFQHYLQNTVMKDVY